MTWIGGRPGDTWSAAPAGGRRGTLAESDEDTGKIFQWSVVRRLGAYILPHKARVVVGLHDNIPNGRTAPGYTLPAFVVPMNGFTNGVASATSAA